jgi:hypothetical protein
MLEIFVMFLMNTQPKKQVEVDEMLGYLNEILSSKPELVTTLSLKCEIWSDT